MSHLGWSGQWGSPSQDSGDVTWGGQDRSVGKSHLGWSGQVSGDVSPRVVRTVGMSHLGWSGQVSGEVSPGMVRTGEWGCLT